MSVRKCMRNESVGGEACIFALSAIKNIYKNTKNNLPICKIFTNGSAARGADGQRPPCANDDATTAVTATYFS